MKTTFPTVPWKGDFPVARSPLSAAGKPPLRKPGQRHILSLLALTLVFFVAGCASQPKPKLSRSEAAKINWSERVGSYTYEQALADLGRPMVTGESGDGRTAEWVLRRSPRMSFGFGVGSGSYGRHGGVDVGAGSTVTPPPSGEYLRLKFGADGKLKEWTKVRY